MAIEPTEAEGLRRRQRAIVELGLLSIRERSLQTLLDEAARLVRDALEADCSKVLERRPSGALFIRAGAGWPPDVVGSVELPPDEESQASYALRLREPVIVRDLPNETRFTPSDVFLELGVRSGVNVVIEQTPSPFGILEVDCLSVRDYSADDVDFLQSAANLLSVAIERQQYEEERDHLVHVAAHELRNPLAVVIGFSQRVVRQLRAGTMNPEQQLRDLTEVHGSAVRMQRLIEMLLELGRIERGATMPGGRALGLVDTVRQIIEHTSELYPQVQFRDRLPDDEVTLDVDEDLARMVIGNIVENAAKYSSRDPEVVVSVSEIEEGRRLSVRDRCGGIAGEELDRLFDRYFRGHSANEFRGFGLGLFIAHRSAETLAWRIEVENHPGDGCEFHITIPHAQIAARPATAS